LKQEAQLPLKNSASLGNRKYGPMRDHVFGKLIVQFTADVVQLQ